MVDPARERQAIALFQELLEIPEAGRDAWIAARCGDDAALCARLEAMRRAERSAAMQTGAALDTVAQEEPPERIGAYRIVELIGRGGMGSVYRGERATGDFTHQVAIKIIKPGLLSEALIERFQRERQTLATLTHPNIAQLYDGGETELGAPYIVMELVDGLPLLDWADTNQASRATRLALFDDVCAAVAFAHRNLIVHRDLTPSNVLVTQGGIAKLIDFGIAKPADADADGAPGSSVSIVSLSLTPGYAAPERMTGARATTATDVYSLGKILAQLTSPTGGDRELAAIVTCATAAEPERRYATVDAMRADLAALSRHLPVAAVAGGPRYRLGKFLARYRGPAIAAGLALCALVGAVIISTRAYARAETARAAEARRFAQLRSLAFYLLFDLDERLSRTVGNTAARADLARQAQAYLSNLAASPAADSRLRYEAAQGLIKLARIQGVPSEPNLGEGPRARRNLETAERLLAGIEALPAADVAPVRAQAMALSSVVYLHGDGEAAKAAAMLDRAERTFASVPPRAGDAAWIEARRTLRKAQLEHADLGDRAPDIARYAALLERDIAAWPAAMRGNYRERLDRAYAAHYRALARFVAGDAKASVPLFVGANRQFDDLLREQPNEPTALYMRAYDGSIGFGAASQLGREDISTTLVASAERSVDQLLRLEPNDAAVQGLAANIKEAKAQNLRDHDRFAEAVALQRDVVARRRMASRRTPTSRASGNLAFSLAILGVIGKDAKDRELACTSWGEAEARFSALAAQKQLIGFFAGFIPGLQANLRRCAAGRPVTEFGPLRST